MIIRSKVLKIIFLYSKTVLFKDDIFLMGSANIVQKMHRNGITLTKERIN